LLKNNHPFFAEKLIPSFYLKKNKTQKTQDKALDAYNHCDTFAILDGHTTIFIV